MTLDKVAAFSDSDDSDDGLHFLPTTPQPDMNEQKALAVNAYEAPLKTEPSSPPESEKSNGGDEGKTMLFEHSNFYPGLLISVPIFRSVFY
jgi:hypothetical protein